MSPDKIYLIHYTKLIKRLEKIKPILDATDVEYEIIDAFDQEDLSEELLQGLYAFDSLAFAEKIKDLWNAAEHIPRQLNLPEISCTLKHLEAIRKLSLECPNYGLILEDDVIFDDAFGVKFQKYFSETPHNWDAVFLGEGCGSDYQQYRISKGKQLSPNSFDVGHPSTNCAEAYIMKPQMAKKIYDSAKPFHLVSDWEIAYQLYKFDAKVYWWIPSLITQGSKNGTYNSTLDLGQR